MKKFIFTFFSFLLLINLTFAQQYSKHTTYNDLKFLNYLINNRSFIEAEYLLQKINCENASHTLTDTINFLKGWVFYNQKKLDSSSHYLLRVTENSPYFLKSRFYSAYNQIYLNASAKPGGC